MQVYDSVAVTCGFWKGTLPSQYDSFPSLARALAKHLGDLHLRSRLRCSAFSTLQIVDSISYTSIVADILVALKLVFTHFCHLFPDGTACPNMVFFACTPSSHGALVAVTKAEGPLTCCHQGGEL